MFSVCTVHMLVNTMLHRQCPCLQHPSTARADDTAMTSSSTDIISAVMCSLLAITAFAASFLAVNLTVEQPRASLDLEAPTLAPLQSTSLIQVTRMFWLVCQRASFGDMC